MSMEPVVLDTDVTSLNLKGKLSPDMLRMLAGQVPLITFVTLTVRNGLRRMGDLPVLSSVSCRLPVSG